MEGRKMRKCGMGAALVLILILLSGCKEGKNPVEMQYEGFQTDMLEIETPCMLRSGGKRLGYRLYMIEDPEELKKILLPLQNWTPETAEEVEQVTGKHSIAVRFSENTALLLEIVYVDLSGNAVTDGEDAVQMQFFGILTDSHGSFSGTPNSYDVYMKKCYRIPLEFGEAILDYLGKV